MTSSAKLDVIERTIRTTIQVTAGAVLAFWVEAGSFSNISWNLLWQVAVYTAVLSLLMALAGTKRGNPDTASFLDTEE